MKHSDSDITLLVIMFLGLIVATSLFFARYGEGLQKCHEKGNTKSACFELFR